jgi:hypothetical protein
VSLLRAVRVRVGAPNELVTLWRGGRGGLVIAGGALLSETMHFSNSSPEAERQCIVRQRRVKGFGGWIESSAGDVGCCGKDFKWFLEQAFRFGRSGDNQLFVRAALKLYIRAGNAFSN